MRVAAGVGAFGAVLACAGERIPAVPACTPAPVPTAECLQTAEVARHRTLVVETLRDQLRWEHSAQVPVGVDFDARSAIAGVCVGDAGSAVAWGVRRRVERSAEVLRALSPGPACLAGCRLDVTLALAALSAPAPTDGARDAAIARCLFRDAICSEPHAPVCAVFADGHRSTQSNACDACRNRFVKGYVEGDCPRR